MAGELFTPMVHAALSLVPMKPLPFVPLLPFSAQLFREWTA